MKVCKNYKVQKRNKKNQNHDQLYFTLLIEVLKAFKACLGFEGLFRL